MSPGRAQFVRYLGAGGVNTAVTYALLLLAMRWLDYLVAYTMVYGLGMAIGYVLQSRFVFRVRMRARTALRFPLAYVIQYLIGMALLWSLVDVLRVGSEVAALLVIAITVVVGFVMSRFLLEAN